MNITATSLAAALPSCHALAASRNRPQSEKYELIDTVLIGAGWAEDIGAEAAPLHAEIARLTAEKRAADEAEAARIAALPPTERELDDKADQEEGARLAELAPKLADGTIRAEDQLRILQWLFKLEQKRREFV
jgi:hypothetical protein